MRPHNATLILSTRDLYAKLRNAHWKAGPTTSELTAFDPDNLDIPEKYDDCRWMHNFYSWGGYRYRPILGSIVTCRYMHSWRDIFLSL